MGRSDVNHFKLLNRWPHQMHENAWHFNQITGAGPAPLTAPCDEVYIQFDRDNIADGLNQAVEMMAEVMGFYPRPTWVNERVFIGRGYPQQLQTLNLRWGYIQEFGIRTTSLIEAGVAVTYSDADGDGIEDTATISVATAISASEIQAFFQVADGAESAGHVNWEIEPLTVTSNGVTATLVGPKYLFVKPSEVWAQEYEEPNYTVRNNGDTEAASDFVLNVDIYRVYSATGSDVVINSDPIFCSSCGSSLGTMTTTAGTGLIMNSRNSLVRTRPANCCTTCGYWPETIDIYYKAGYPLNNGKMERRLEIAAMRLGNTLMAQQPTTSCDRALEMWQRDLEEIQILTTDQHPFGGTRRGRVEAWGNIRHMVLGQGGKVTSRWA